MKRVDGLERQLQKERRSTGSASPEHSHSAASPTSTGSGTKRKAEDYETRDPRAEPLSCSKPIPPQPRTASSLETESSQGVAAEQKQQAQQQRQQRRATPYEQPYSHIPSPSTNHLVTVDESILDSFFKRVNEKPFYLLDEQATRERHRNGQLPPTIALAIHAITLRRTTAHDGSLATARRLSQKYALEARQMIETDVPSLDNLQCLLILVLVFFANGQGRRSYMTFVFWTCYILDRFFACGSRRPTLVLDASIALKLPSWQPTAGGLLVEGDAFRAGPNLRYCSDPHRIGHNAVSLLIDVTRILGVANQYLASGGVKGDSHFPWHSQSAISRIRSDLEVWASSTQDVFASVESLFGHPQASILLLSKLIYHLVHCIIYRPFLAIDLVELQGTGQHHSWQIEATSLCFSHANAIIDLVDLGRASNTIEWTAFVGHCVWTAGTVHIHGAQYRGAQGEVFSASANYLMRGTSQLTWLTDMWTGIQHHQATLRMLQAAHSGLVRAAEVSPMATPIAVFHLEGFFERYEGYEFDGSHAKMIDLPIAGVVDG
ncbi:hypothetical protein KEM52_001432, partial [Ascosphaera acerosa]